MRVAKELPAGAYVNLGIGIPTLVSNYVPEGRTVLYHSESGVLNCGPLVEEGKEDVDLINAGGQFLEMVPGMSFFSSSEAFAMVRGGHIDVTVLGALQVSEKGDLANWMLPQRGVGNIGGAMDLAAGAKRIIVAMEHTDRRDNPKIVRQCTYPPTGRGLRQPGGDRHRRHRGDAPGHGAPGGGAGMVPPRTFRRSPSPRSYSLPT